MREHLGAQDIDKFTTFGLTPAAASCVKAPLIAECYANLECRVVDTQLVATYNFFILEVLKAWIDPAKKQPEDDSPSAAKALSWLPARSIKLPSKMK